MESVTETEQGEHAIMHSGQMENSERRSLLVRVAVAAWHAGAGPAAMQILLSSLCFTYFFAPPVCVLA
jgi:K+-sensing histidine kinase KdpD